MKNIEKGVGFKGFFKDFRHDVSLKSVTNGILAAIFTMTFLMFFYAVLPNYGLESTQMDEWLTACLSVMGIGTILLPIYFRKPIAMAGSFASWLCFMSLAGSGQYQISDIMGACMVSGVLLIILAVTGLMKKVLDFLPGPVVNGMIAGCFLSYGLYIVNPLATDPIVVVLMVAAYLIASKKFKRIPGVLAALVVAVIYYAIVGLDLPSVSIKPVFPKFTLPTFSSSFPELFLAMTIPMAALVLGAENAQAYGVLRTEEFDPPINFMTMISGVGGVIACLFSGVNVNIAGPLTAITASEDSGEKKGRWTATVVLGVLLLIIAPFYASLVGWVTLFPKALIQLVTGLSVLAILTNSLRGSVMDVKHRTSGIIAFLVSASGVKILGLSAPFWALLLGDVIYIFYEGGLKKNKEEKKA